MNRMIERVARAICAGDPDRIGGRVKIERLDTGETRIYSDESDLIPEWQQDVNLAHARRAVEALLYPTADMRYAGCMKIGEWGAHQGESPQWLPPYNIETRWAGKRVVNIFQAMIYAALAPNDGGDAA